MPNNTSQRQTAAGQLPLVVGLANPTALDETCASYYASIAQAEGSVDNTVRYRLRPEMGCGTIEVTALPTGFHLIRYDVTFTEEHRVEFSFPADYFELEHCLDGRMNIREFNTGSGEMHANSVSLSPRCATDGVVTHRGRERYRAVSIIGTWTGLESYLDRFGTDIPHQIGSDRTARERYLGNSTILRPAAGPLEDMFMHRRSSPGRLLYLESRLTAALAALVDTLTSRVDDDTADAGLSHHEIVALRRVPDLLWRHRHNPPTLADLAKVSFMSTKRLVAGFRALYGISVMEHHRRRCLDRAAGLLVETDWKIARIGHAVGYSSPSSFGFAFRESRGITPARYRREHS